jgi:signal transduction histidine kinase
MPGTPETTSARSGDTAGKTSCGCESSGGAGGSGVSGGDADALRFVDTADVLSQFMQIEGRFTQVKQGLAHLQRLATLGTLTATLIHEFNNILTPITSYAQLALLKPDDKALARKTHEKTLDAANRATKLCAALLGYAREEDEHTPARAQLDEVVQASLACLGNGLASRGIDVVLELTDAQAAISPAGLEQVLVNLILNARKAMLGAGGTLTIRTRCDQSSVRIEVADTGPGVPAHIADRVFEPFVTAPPGGGGNLESWKSGKLETQKRDQNAGMEDREEPDGSIADKPGEGGNASGGTGLGLSVCRDLVRRAGGDIGFESRPGEGTTFHITLPKAEPIRRAG